MKKKTIVVISLITVFVFVGLIFLIFNGNGFLNHKTTKEDNTTNESENGFEGINFSTNTITLGDDKTEVGIKIENSQEKDVLITEIAVVLYDSEDNVLEAKNESINLTIRAGEIQSVIVNFDKKYADTANIKYEILK